jgi:hypothetical protein
VSTTGNSGRRSLEVCRARRRRSQLVSLRLSGRGGFASVVVCHHPSSARFRDVTCRSRNERRSPSTMPAAAVSVRLPGGWGEHRQRSHGNCDVMRPREAEASSTGPRLRSGTPTGRRSARRSPSSRQTSD